MGRTKQKNPHRLGDGKHGVKSGSDGAKRARRYRPGTKALMEIRRQQKKSGESFAGGYAPMNRFIRELTRDMSNGGDIRFSSKSINALIESSEELVIDIMRLANYFSVKIGKRKGISIEDYRLAAQVFLHPHSLRNGLESTECASGVLIMNNRIPSPPKSNPKPATNLLPPKKRPTTMPVQSTAQDDSPENTEVDTNIDSIEIEEDEDDFEAE